jgi:hypothetical protein
MASCARGSKCNIGARMTEALPTRLLLQLAQATPDQLAAVARFLAGEPLPEPQGSPALATGSVGDLKVTLEGDPATGQFCIRVRRAGDSPPVEPHELDEADPKTRSLAARVFELLSALDGDDGQRKAPPIKVFNFYYRQGLEPAEIARRCKCHRSTIFERLAEIRENLPWSPQQLREVSPHVEAMEDGLSDSRARDIYRKGAVTGDEEADDPDTD